MTCGSGTIASCKAAQLVGADGDTCHDAEEQLRGASMPQSNGRRPKTASGAVKRIPHPALRITRHRGPDCARAVQGAFQRARKVPRSICKCSYRFDTELALGALEYAGLMCGGQPALHAVRGSTYTAKSMGSIGDATSTPSGEILLYTVDRPCEWKFWRTEKDADNALFSNIDVGTTPTQPEESGWRSPDDYEANYHQLFPAGGG